MAVLLEKSVPVTDTIASPRKLNVDFVDFIDFRVMGDHRGSLISLEGNNGIPFDIKRVYYIFETTHGTVRGFHANKNSNKVMICTSGSCKFLLDDGRRKQVVTLDNPAKGMYVHGLIWREIFDFTPDCVLMVLADTVYDEREYVRNYQDFLREVTASIA